MKYEGVYRNAILKDVEETQKNVCLKANGPPTEVCIYSNQANGKSFLGYLRKFAYLTTVDPK